MLKPASLKVVAATAFLAVAGSSYVYAQQGWGGHRGYGDGPRFEHRHRSPADIAAFTDARIAALKAGLELTPDQVKNWPPFEQAVRDMAQLRIQRMQARQAAADQQTTSTPFDRMSRRADNMAKASAALKKVADAGAPLYASLNDDQKARFGELARMLRPHHHMRGDNDGDGRGWNRGGEGPGWGHGRRFGEDNGPRGRMQNLMNGDADQGSQL
jgi:zinc resistance-associated protein